MKQIVIIHGGTTFLTYNEYLEYLQTRKVSAERLKAPASWRENLQNDLGDEYEVLRPRMPDSTNARYNEWKIWFDRITEILHDDCILIGHSLGAIFLVKYLSENRMPVKVAGTFLVATPYANEAHESLTDFKLKGITPLFSEEAGKVTFINGKDDPIISIDDIERYRAELPDAEHIITPAPDHFMRPHLPVLVERILTL